MLMTNDKTKLPILTHPSAPPLPYNWPRHACTPEQIAKLEELKGMVPDMLVKDEGRAEEEAWCDESCLLRYLRATKWNVAASAKRLQSTLVWRREYKPHQIDPSEVEPEAETGKEFLSGFDLQGRPLIYMIPRNENTKTYDRQLRFVVYNLEKGIRMMPPGVESLVLVIDYEGLSMFNAPPASQAKKVLQILGDHYPERLGMGFLINPTWYVWGFFKIIGPFLDPVTRSKIHFVNLKKQAELNKASEAEKRTKEVEGTGGWTNIRYYIAPEMLLNDYGGDHPFEYDAKAYWKAINEI